MKSVMCLDSSWDNTVVLISPMFKKGTKSIKQKMRTNGALHSFVFRMYHSLRSELKNLHPALPSTFTVITWLSCAPHCGRTNSSIFRMRSFCVDVVPHHYSLFSVPFPSVSFFIAWCHWVLFLKFEPLLAYCLPFCNAVMIKYLSKYWSLTNSSW